MILVVIFYLLGNSLANLLTCNNDYCVCQIGVLTQSKSPTYNGCGSDGNHIPTPPDWGFEPVCNNHDICYGTCGKHRQICDTNFGNGLVLKCVNNVKVGSARDYCIMTADLMYDAVKHYGNKYFEQAQRDDCTCS